MHKTEWSDALAAVKELNKTLNQIEELLEGLQSSNPIMDTFNRIFSNTKGGL